MKQLIIFLSCVVAFGAFEARGQSQEAQQLLLNWEKLQQLKAILNNMYEGYQVLVKGYNSVRDISQGNFQLHKQFLDNLLQVSPSVQKYKAVGEIIGGQKRLISELRQASGFFKRTGQLTAGELAHMAKIYKRITDRSLKNLEDLLLVIGAGRLRMNDQERLESIDRISNEMEEIQAFFKSFNTGFRSLAAARKAEQTEVDVLRKFNGIE